VPEPPLILVTNDDGLGSPGLRAAAEAVADLGELLLVAPATQQTGMSRAFVTDAGAGVIERAEMRIAGRAVGVSGTVGAAFEADSLGIPSIAAAISASVSEWRTFGTVDWTAAGHFTRLLASQVLTDGMPTGVSVLNLNVPRSATIRTELRKTVQSQHPYYVRRRPGSARPLDQPYQFAVEVGIDPDRLEPGTDIHAIVRDQVVSVTPLTWQQTAATDWTPAREG
jgi:5'-nucleotidase